MRGDLWRGYFIIVIGLPDRLSAGYCPGRGDAEGVSELSEPTFRIPGEAVCQVALVGE